MTPMHQFAYGPINPIVAFVMSLVGAAFGLACTARARRAALRRERVRWLLFGGIAIGGVGIWLMHFMAMIGFDVPAAQIRFNVPLTALSLVIAVVVVTAGLFLVGLNRPTVPKILIGGPLTGIGIAAMHYTGMAAMRLDGTIEYNMRIVEASVLIAVIAATAALWFTVAATSVTQIAVASVIFALAVCCMHYSGMLAVRVRMNAGGGTPSGIAAMDMVLPITVMATLSLLAMLFASATTAGGEVTLTVDQAALAEPSRWEMPVAGQAPPPIPATRQQGRHQR